MQVPHLCSAVPHFVVAATLVCVLNFTITAEAQFTQVAPNWTVVDVANGTKPSFDFDSDGGIHIMGMTEARAGVVWYANAMDAAGPWTSTNLATGYFYGPGDLRVDAVGTPQLAWHDHDLQDAALASVGAEATVVTRIVTPNSHDGWDNSLAIGADGRVHMASIFPNTFGGTNSLTISSLESGVWDSTSVEGSGEAMYGLNTSLALDSNDSMHALYSSSLDWTGPGGVSYASQNERGRWTVDSIEAGLNTGRFPAIAVDAANRVHAAWINVHTDDITRADVRYATLADEWQIETVATLENVRVGFSDARKLVSLEVDAAGTPHLAYGDRDSVHYATRDEQAGWQSTTVVESSDVMLNGLVVLRLDPREDPGIVFWRPAANALDGVVSFAMLDGQDLLGDYDGDGVVGALDIDLLSHAIRTGETDSKFDLNQDDSLTSVDHDFWITELASTVPGDANLNRVVDFPDFLALSLNFGQNGGWAEGDFDGSGAVEFSDFLLLTARFGNAAASVPEPSGLELVFVGVMGLLCYRRKSVVKLIHGQDSKSATSVS